ncbi:DUF3987 domain-containing protein [Streptomyces sp. NPDC047990]|uniref:DUF3987 domain-containing protein n=1 Tax=Streptomyces sp. NPDC047990 TaxID=3365496 RepID=UPI003718D467
MSTFEQMKYGPLGAAVEATMPSSEADPIGVWAASLSLYSAAITRSVRLDNKRPIAIWTVLAGRSAIGRKGYALNTAIGLLEKSIGSFIHARRRAGIGSGAALVDCLAKLELETMGAEGGIDGRAIIIEEEWASVLKDQRRDSKFSSIFRQIWDGKPVSIRTKKDGLQAVASPHMGFHAHITPGEWAAYVSSKEALGGSYNRLLPVLVERSKMLPYNHRPKPVDTTAIRKAFEWANEERRTMRFSEAAGARFDELRAIVEDRMVELPELLSSYMERAAEQVQRVAAVLAATEMKEEISAEAVEAAWAFVSYSMASVEKLVKDAADLSGGKIQKSPEEIVRDTLRRYGGSAPSSTLLRALVHRMNADGLKELVTEMEDVEVIREHNGGRGAPKMVYRLVDQETVEEPEEAPVPEPKPEPKPVPKRAPRARKAPAPKAPPKAATVSKATSPGNQKLRVVQSEKATPAPRKKPAAPTRSAPAVDPANPFSSLLMI